MQICLDDVKLWWTKIALKTFREWKTKKQKWPKILCLWLFLWFGFKWRPFLSQYFTRVHDKALFWQQKLKVDLKFKKEIKPSVVNGVVEQDLNLRLFHSFGFVKSGNKNLRKKNWWQKSSEEYFCYKVAIWPIFYDHLFLPKVFYKTSLYLQIVFVIFLAKGNWRKSCT